MKLVNTSSINRRMPLKTPLQKSRTKNKRDRNNFTINEKKNLKRNRKTLQSARLDPLLVELRDEPVIHPSFENFSNISSVTIDGDPEVVSDQHVLFLYGSRSSISTHLFNNAFAYEKHSSDDRTN